MPAEDGIMDKEVVLSKVGLFEGVAPKHIKGIAAISTERNFPAGAYLTKQGESGIGLFIIAEGKVKVEKKDDSGRIVETSENGEGDVIGEMAVLDGAPRTASVVAAVDTKCLALTSWEFNAFMKTHPEVALDILPVIVKRFRETNEALLKAKKD
jgi:CRP/FNR family transcriptional regulator, cyclic AMP receptor protein